MRMRYASILLFLLIPAAPATLLWWWNAANRTDTLPPSDGFVRVGTPSSQQRVIPDLEVFRGRLYVATSTNPLMQQGASLWSTQDGSTFERLIDQPTSEGFLRVRALGGMLFVPEADPPGYEGGRVWISRDGKRFTPTTVPGVVHSYDVADFAGHLLSSNGAADGSGGLFRWSPDQETWSRIAEAGSRRLQYMVEYRGRLYVAKTLSGTPADFLVWSDDLAAPPQISKDVVPGEAHTWRWYVSGRNRLFWSHWSAEGGHEVRYTDDGESWALVPELSDQFASDFAELDGHLYVLTASGLWGSRDHARFEQLIASTGPFPFAPVVDEARMNVEAMASMASYRDALWCGSSRNGSLYRVEFSGGTDR